MQSKLSQPLLFKEEVANSLSHGLAALLMLGLLPLSAIYSYQAGGRIVAVGTSVFIISLFLMFLSSAIYHAMRYDTPQKYVLRVIDHSMIYIAIAGSYTPIALSLLQGWSGYGLLIGQWLLTVVGILYKIFAKTIHAKFSLALYLLMGWLVIFFLPMILAKTSLTFDLLMLAGGLAYTIGAVFYAKKRPYFHFIWHLFIILAAILQYLAIVFFML